MHPDSVAVQKLGQIFLRRDADIYEDQDQDQDNDNDIDNDNDNDNDENYNW
jgi:hypothetical protein